MRAPKNLTPPTIPAEGKYIRFVRGDKVSERRSGFIGYFNGLPVAPPCDTWAEASEAVDGYVYTLITHAHSQPATA